MLESVLRAEITSRLKMQQQFLNKETASVAMSNAQAPRTNYGTNNNNGSRNSNGSSNGEKTSLTGPLANRKQFHPRNTGAFPLTTAQQVVIQQQVPQVGIQQMGFTSEPVTVDPEIGNNDDSTTVLSQKIDDVKVLYDMLARKLDKHSKTVQQKFVDSEKHAQRELSSIRSLIKSKATK